MFENSREAVDARDPSRARQCAELCTLWDPRWYATYTNSRCEKRVASILQQRNIQSFLPLYEVVRRGDKGRRIHCLPLFPGYVFVRIPLQQYRTVLQVPGVVRFVAFNGQAAVLDDAEIENLRNALMNGIRAKPHPYVEIGRKVQIQSGPLQGLCGRIVRTNSRYRVIVSVELLHRSILIDVDGIDLGLPLSGAA